MAGLGQLTYLRELRVAGNRKPYISTLKTLKCVWQAWGS